MIYVTTGVQYWTLGTATFYSMHIFEMFMFLLLLIEIVNVINIVIYNNDNINSAGSKELLLGFNISPVVRNKDLTRPNTLLDVI